MQSTALTLTDIINKNIVELLLLGFNEKSNKSLRKLGAKYETLMFIVGKNGNEYYRIPENDLPEWTNYCKYIRDFKDKSGNNYGNELCSQCDINKANEFLQGVKGKREWYMCHGGLIDIAIPIKVGGNVVAVFFGGQKRLKGSPKYLKESEEKIKELLYNIPELDKNKLMKYFDQVPELKESEIEKHITELSEIALYISDLARNNFESRETIKLMSKFSEEYLTNRLPKNEMLRKLFEEAFSFISVRELILVRFGHNRSIVSFPETYEETILITDDFIRIIDEILETNNIPNRDAVFLDAENKSLSDLEKLLQLSDLKYIFLKIVKFAVGDFGIFFYINPKLDDMEIKNPDIMNKRKEFIHDLSERLKNSIDMFELDEMKDELMAEVTHRLKSPMQLLISETSTIIERLKTLKKWLPIEPKIMESVEKIGPIINFMDVQIKNYLIISTIDKEEMAYDMHMHPIGLLVEICVSQYDHLAETKNITLNCSIDKKSYERSSFDWNQVQVVIYNLLDNAIKYSHRNRTVYISCRFDEHKKLYSLKFDSFGVGIAKEEQEKIFLKFRRGKIMKDPRRFIPGTGIGLTVSRKIARDHKGDVVLRECRQGEGIEGKGFIEEGWKIVFEFALPLKYS